MSGIQHSTARNTAAKLMILLLAMALLAMESAAHAQTARMERSLASQVQQFVHFSMSMGRINVSGPRLPRSMSTSTAGARRRERLSLDLHGPTPQLVYVQTSSDARISIEVMEAGQVQVALEPRGDESHAPRLELSQAVGEGVTLVIGAETPAARTVKASNFWLLYMAEPEICREHLTPILQLMRPEWRLTETMQAAEVEIMRLHEQALAFQQVVDERAADNLGTAPGESSVQSDEMAAGRWQRLVNNLGSDRFSTRLDADRQLRALGPVVLDFLQQSLQDPLDAEQQFRIRTIIDDLTGAEGDDNARRVGSMLYASPETWYALLSSDEVGKRVAAKERLEKMLRQPITFDPRADAPRRAAQAAQIRAVLDARQP